MDDIEGIIFIGCNAIETFIMNYPQNLDEFISNLKPETNPDLRIVLPIS